MSANRSFPPSAAAAGAEAKWSLEGKAQALEALRGRIAAIEGRVPELETHTGLAPEEAVWGMGPPAIDACLGEARRGIGTLHDLAPDAYADAPAAAGFGLALLVRLAGGTANKRAILWCQNATVGREFGLPYGPGLVPLGLEPDSLILVTAARDREVLWALEEGLHARGLAAVVGEIGGVDFTATRRLALACGAAGVPCLLLRGHGDGRTSAAHTRWRVSALPSVPDAWDAQAPGRARWRLELLRCRGGRPGQWDVEWNGETGTFDLAPPVADRPVAPRSAREPWRRTG